MTQKWSLAFALLLALAGCSGGGEKKDGDKPKVEKKAVADADVPAPVAGALAKAFPGAKTVGWWQRGTTYGARGTVAGHWIDVKIEPDGTLKESSEQITVAAAPEPVKKAFNDSEYAKLPLVDATKRIKTGDKGDTLYKFIVKKGDAAEIAVYGDDGKLVKVKDFPKEKLEKWSAEHTALKN